MTIELGISPLIPPDVHHDGRPSDIGSWVEGADLHVGWMVLLDDGRWAEVVGAPVLHLLGKVSLDVSWQGHEAEQATFGFRRLAWCRTPAQEAEYMQAIDDEALMHETGRRALMGGSR